MRPRRVVLLRGTAANPWDLRPWEELGPGWDVEVVVPPNNDFDTSSVRSKRVPVQTAGGLLRRAGLRGTLPLKVVGERYIGLRRALEGADIVHAAELGTWYAAQAAGLRTRLGFRLALTVWETLPFGSSYRNVRTRAYRRQVLAATDVFLPVTERAGAALVLEGAPATRLRVCPPGVDVERYTAARTPRPPADGSHLLVSIGRLVWEKGHQDLLRAVALLRERGRHDIRMLIVGTGPEEKRLRAVASDLGLTECVELRGWIPHEELTDVYARASCLVLASLPVWFWEEQFGMVLAEAMAAHVPIVASSSGAIPEVVGSSGTLFAPGDWVGLADALERGPLTAAPGTRQAPDASQLKRFSATVAAGRLREVYEQLTAA